MLPKAGNEANKSPLKLIEEAIDQGVPVFNDGNPAKCATIYRDCMVAITKNPKVDPEVRKTGTLLLEIAEKVEDDSKRAWLLRRGLDQLYSAISGK